jgi:hypothetical protein
MTQDTRNLINERESRYGSLADNSACTWELIAVLQKYGFDKFNAVQKHLVYMTMHKLARMTCGDPNYIDNYDDIIGYWTRARDFVPLETGVHISVELEKFIEDKLAEPDEPNEVWKAGTPEDGGQHAPENEKYDLRDGTRSQPQWANIPIFDTEKKEWYHLVDRNHFSEGAIEHLPRLQHVINNSEHMTLPPFYRPLYDRNTMGGFNLKDRYKQHWGI